MSVEFLDTCESVDISFGTHSRVRAPDYERMVSTRSTPLLGKPIHADWDRSLTEAMTEFSIKIEEEAVLGDLILDLSEAGWDAQ